jgi:TRAP transporter TAXI family solute receptor
VAAAPKFISIGTGGVTGVYYPTGGAICRLVNRNHKVNGLRCSVESTGGSVYNINTVRAGELEFGVAQSDWQYHAYHGTSKFKEQGKFEDLRSVFSLHPEPVTVLARSDAGINNIEDLKGKRLNIGNPGSGTRATWEVLEEALGWQRSDLKLAATMKSAETAQALCDNKIDAYFWLVGHPSALTQETVSSCHAVLVNVAGEAIDKLVAQNPFYRHATIPGGMYPGQPDDVKTFGVGATFITSAKVPEAVVYEVAKAVLGNLDVFRKLHPAFAHLNADEMIKDSLSAPLHDGAIKAYKELGLMP